MRRPELLLAFALLGASLRLRYRRNGANVYLQYKGPGFLRRGLLFRSEFSTERLRDVTMEESHHDIVHFTDTTVQDILDRRYNRGGRGRQAGRCEPHRLHGGADHGGRVPACRSMLPHCVRQPVEDSVGPDGPLSGRERVHRAGRSDGSGSTGRVPCYPLGRPIHASQTPRRLILIL